MTFFECLLYVMSVSKIHELENYFLCFREYGFILIETTFVRYEYLLKTVS